MPTASAPSSRDARVDLLDTWTRLLRSPQALVDTVAQPGGLALHAPALLAATVAGGALLGGVVGSHHGGIQTVYAAIKTPLLFLVPPLFALPAVEAVWSLVGTPVSGARLRAAALVGMARAAILAAALGPFVWLWTSAGVDYHLAVLGFAGTVVLAGLPGLVTVLRALPRPTEMRRLVIFGSLAVLGGVFAQTGWLLRPFVARPTAEATFLRPVEENIFSSLASSQRSARGRYTGWSARRRGFLADDTPPPTPVDRFTSLRSAAAPSTPAVAPAAVQPRPASTAADRAEAVPAETMTAETEPAETAAETMAAETDPAETAAETSDGGTPPAASTDETEASEAAASAPDGRAAGPHAAPRLDSSDPSAAARTPPAASGRDR